MRHPLEAAHSPLVRALPEYERQFEQQLVEARAYWETSQQRMHWCGGLARRRGGAGRAQHVPRCI
jgi:autophagy-related protein 11